ncbi:MAG: electron transfer flavoprotein subunit alpha/FixB family protein [Thermodesulfobacteriota bacterium]|jgi:electron transfer flavoprotein alpha subunit|nr:MAG: electron transfer flavoprotein subunit alpha/FixB family protein [Thermodesulfobacteriota bacterium]
MSGIWVLIEHRRGEIREISYEMLGKGRMVAEKLKQELSAVILASDAKAYVDKIKKYASRILTIEDKQLEHYNALSYQAVLSALAREKAPTLLLMGHTSYGMDLAPRLSAALKWPLATDSVEVEVSEGNIEAIRKMYSDKVNARIGFRGAKNCLVSVRPGSFPAEIDAAYEGEVISVTSSLTTEIQARKFIEFVEAATGAVDITQADILVSVGRGIGDAENIPLAEALAQALGATLSCSRPVVDKKWLPKERQVGTSGKTVKPKVYIALGISGAFQHVAGMKNSGAIIAVNKDPKAPIFNVAQYGIVDDLLKVLPVLTEKVKALRAA